MNNSRKWFNRFYKNGTQSQVKRQVEAPYWYEDLENRYIKLLDKRLALEEEIRDLRAELLEWMHEDNCKRVTTNKTSTVIIHEYQGRRIDAGKLKRDYPKIFYDYSNPYTMSEHLQITVNRQ